MEVGVWYQQYSGGPSGYWAGVWSYPQHEWIYRQRPRDHQLEVLVGEASRPGEYATVYGTTYNGRNYRNVFYTAVR